MEKKTIGKFIAVLRKANGLTQAELAEKLFVSDKTVSRWERDESSPDLELIPLIADLFDVTTDEILRGERAPAPSFLNKIPDKSEQEKEKAEKRLKKLLDKRYIKFKYLSFVSYGIAVLGFIAALICVFCVRSDKVDENILGGLIFTACLAIATLCQIAFVGIGIYRDDEEENGKAIEEYRFQFQAWSVNSFLPLLSFFGLAIPFFLIDKVATDNFNTVLPFLGVCLAVTFPLVGYFVYYFYQKSKNKKQKISLEQRKAIVKLKRKVWLPIAAALVLLFTSITVLIYGTSAYHYANAKVFDTTEAFVTYMEQKTELGDLDKEPFHGSSAQSGGSDGFYFSTYGEWTKLGDTDILFYWANESVAGYTLSDKKNGLPVKVYEKQAIKTAEKIKTSVILTLSCLAVGAMSTGIAVYTIKKKNIEK